jgi:outer membrane protein OmpA-like peptidoglycan-associated protein
MPSYTWEQTLGKPGYTAPQSAAWNLRWWILMAVFSSVVLHAGMLYFLRDLGMGQVGEALAETSAADDGRFEDQIHLDPKLLEQTLSATPEISSQPKIETNVTEQLPPIDEIARHLKGDITLSPETAVPLNIEFRAPKQGDAGPSVDAVNPVDSAIVGAIDNKIRTASSSDILKTATADPEQVKIKMDDQAATGPDALKGELAAARKRGDNGLKGLGFSSLDDLMDLKTPQTGDMKAMIPSRTLFDYNSTEVKESAKVELAKLAFLLMTWTKAEFHIEGHSDSFGNDAYNLDLSRRRAEAVKEWVVNTMKVDGARIFTEGFGETQPIVDPNGSIDAQELNRRVVIRIVNH